MLRQTTRKKQVASKPISAVSTISTISTISTVPPGYQTGSGEGSSDHGAASCSDCGPSHLLSSQRHRDRRTAQPIAFQVVSPLSVAPPPDGCAKSKRIFGNAPSVSICDGTRSDLWISVSYSQGLLILSLSLSCGDLASHWFCINLPRGAT